MLPIVQKVKLLAKVLFTLKLQCRSRVVGSKLSLQGGFPEDAASRAYYAMMYVIQALLVNNTPDSFLNDSTRLSELTLQGLIYFFKVSPTLNLRKKISPTTTSGLEPQNLLKFCPEYCVNQGLENKTHRGLLTAFGKNVAKTGMVPPEFHHKLIDAERLRIKADYGVANAVTNEEARQQVKYGKQFLQLGNQLIAKPHYQSLYEHYAKLVGNAGTQIQVDYQIALRAFQGGLNYQDIAYVLAQSPQCQELKPDITKAKEYVDNILGQAESEVQRSQDSDIDLD